MKVVFNPINNYTNKYIQIIINLLQENGIEVYGLKYTLKRPLLFFQIKIFHLNWFESLGGDNKYSVFKSFLKQTFKLFILKIFNKKIIWTMHNKMPHEQSFIFFKELMLKKIAKNADVIIIHSKISMDILVNQMGINANKIKYCPHPNYINDYGSIIKQNQLKNSNKLKLLFLGMVRPYKNIELLMEVVDELKELDIELKIIGSPMTEDYGNYLTNYKINNTAIKLELGFVEDEKIPVYLSESDILVMPLNIESSLNSGSVILAFSYKKTVICPKIGTVSDLPDLSSIYSYSYQTQKEHKEELKKNICKAYNETKSNIDKYGEALYNYVLKEHSKEKVRKILKNIYSELDYGINKKEDESLN